MIEVGSRVRLSARGVQTFPNRSPERCGIVVGVSWRHADLVYVLWDGTKNKQTTHINLLRNIFE